MIALDCCLAVCCLCLGMLRMLSVPKEEAYLRECSGGGGAAQLHSEQATGQTPGKVPGQTRAPQKRVSITFDDGPHPKYTQFLLDGLKERGVRATFFVTGEHAAEYPELILRMKEEGHLIGNHTYSHLELRNGNEEQYLKELQKTNETLKQITGQEVQYVRPPYGSWKKGLEKKANMLPVLWTVDPLDWSCLNAGTVVKRVMKEVGENSIILLHDSYVTSVDAALKIVDELTAQGYELVTVEELLWD